MRKLVDVIVNVAMVGFIVVFINYYEMAYHANKNYKNDTVTLKTTWKYDTIKRIIYDTVPVYKEEKIISREIKRIIRFQDSIRITEDSCMHFSDSLKDTVTIVQRYYKKDSLYSLYISGVKYKQYPKLDSLKIYSSSIVCHEKHILQVNNKKSIKFGIQCGYGIGLVDKKLQPYIGMGISVGF